MIVRDEEGACSRIERSTGTGLLEWMTGGSRRPDGER
jgi:hypothetical protein